MGNKLNLLGRMALSVLPFVIVVSSFVGYPSLYEKSWL